MIVYQTIKTPLSDMIGEGGGGHRQSARDRDRQVCVLPSVSRQRVAKGPSRSPALWGQKESRTTGPRGRQEPKFSAGPERQ